ncbi:hypothetical protein LWC34_52555 [Kibdelosporangium philippinense]|uniref:Tetratricopeptide repeat protein n=1 Tax=Kibdelosporangium philippinense TaxID=211113 RepID=A0ABS8ZXV1_9PSEU|nr:hypothetical protein [Kibdelosporangium philippinense]MCE7011388.1 hypothetical protein [Kibdelosporangium philippinense]
MSRTFRHTEIPLAGWERRTRCAGTVDTMCRNGGHGVPERASRCAGIGRSLGAGDQQAPAAGFAEVRARSGLGELCRSEGNYAQAEEHSSAAADALAQLPFGQIAPPGINVAR